MLEIRREEQFRRLNLFIFQWINTFPPDTPFAIDELWNAAGQATHTFSGFNLRHELALARCREYAGKGLLEELGDGRFLPLGFTAANVDIFMTERSTSPMGAFDLSGKEREPKFQILATLRQARGAFEDAAELCRQQELPISIAFLDIDNFKQQFNTPYTHVVIDRTVLPEFMRLLEVRCAYRALACLHGGDEFLLLLPNSTIDEAYAFVERLRATFEQNVFQIDTAAERLTISAGIATWPIHGHDFEKVMEAADRAMSRAKTRRNAVEKSE